jgi:hydrogenase maturation protease
MKGKVLVACVGNSLVADDAAGYFVYRNLQTRQLPSSVRLVHLGLGGIALLDQLEGESCLVVVDAVRLGGQVGHVHEIEWEGLPRARTAVSSHGIGIREAIELGRATEPQKMPQRVVLIGIEGDCFTGLGEGPCEAVRGGILEATGVVLKMIGLPVGEGGEA